MNVNEFNPSWCHDMRRVMRKPAFVHIRENKDAYQLLGSRAADQRLCFSLHR